MSDFDDEPRIINIRAQLRLITSVLPTLIASLPQQQFDGVLSGLEALTEGVHPPSLAQEIDELRQILAEQVRDLREAMQNPSS